MGDINATLPLLGPVSSTVQQIFGIISLLVGGIFGIYVITLIVRLVFFRKILNMYKELKGQLEILEEKIDKLGKKKR